ncbi:Chemotaxis protein CheA [bioreactor metagenome]|uniref:Chemotaxis protein CheA n=1 Tax=bioreactor metagenome TaxID=1076179 RepID=A0A644W104_9ZZZZ
MKMNVDETMLDVYIYETQQMLESLENTLFVGESEKRLNQDQINEVFRIMHTIKGASAMMEFENMAKLSHTLEDVFSQIRDNGAPAEEWPPIFDLVFSAISFFNSELGKLLDKAPMDGEPAELIGRLKSFLNKLKGEPAGSGLPEQPVSQETADEKNETEAEETFSQVTEEPCYKLKLFFEENCQMESVRAFGVVQSLKGVSNSIVTVPKDLAQSSSDEEIKKNGLCLFFRTNENPDRIKEILDSTLFIKNYSVLAVENEEEETPQDPKESAVQTPDVNLGKGKGPEVHPAENAPVESIAKQNFISVNVNKLDNLLNIVGEIVTAQSMVINSADFGGKQHDSFDAAAQQLHSLINELQDIVMSIRMIPVSTLFQKMRRLVRDMSKKFGKDIELDLVGEETEVDKNVIDYLSDPLLHIIRNSIDHGIEDAETRKAFGKPARGKIMLEARTTGSDVIVTASDDGKGLQRDTILKKALEKGLISRIDPDMPDKDVFNFIFLPGFSTKEAVTEYSGRGVGMDVVRKNISQIGGSITLESEFEKGTTHIIRIPLTLTIVNGMKFCVGNINFIVPTVSVLSVVQPKLNDIFADSSENEMIMIQGKCYSLIRLSRFFGIENGKTELSDGMIMHIASEQKSFCIFFDNLDGEYQVVVKTLPGYLQHCSSGLDGIGGCAIMGDGSINLILDVNGL